MHVLTGKSQILLVIILALSSSFIPLDQLQCRKNLIWPSRGYYHTYNDISLSLADINGDGIHDIVTGMCANFAYIGGFPELLRLPVGSYLVGNREGGFESSHTILRDHWDEIVETWTSKIMVMDQNRDGRDDLIASLGIDYGYPWPPSYILLCLGKEDGKLEYHSIIEYDLYPLDAGKFNDDYYPDLLVVYNWVDWSEYGEIIGALVSYGFNTFRYLDINSYENYYHVSSGLGDLNNDDYSDVVILAIEDQDRKRIQVFLSDGNGEFSFLNGPELPYLYPRKLYIGDINADFNEDVIIAYNRWFMVFLGNGSGLLNHVGNWRIVPLEREGTFHIEDVNGDGFSDVIAATPEEGGKLKVRIGTDSGTFLTEYEYEEIGDGLVGLGFGDFNEDGNKDIVMSFKGYNPHIRVFFGNGEGEFPPSMSDTVNLRFPSTFRPRELIIADFNGDCHEDIICRIFHRSDFDCQSANTLILYGDGEGQFVEPLTFYSCSKPTQAVVGDFNGDGYDDFIVANSDSNNIIVFAGNEKGEFNEPIFRDTGNNPLTPLVADFNNDGLSDIAVSNKEDHTVSILLGDLDSLLVARRVYDVGYQPGIPRIANFNKDDHPDISVPLEEEGKIKIGLGDGEGNFSLSNVIQVGDQIKGHVALDVNNDMNADIVVTKAQTGMMKIYLGDGSGRFLLHQSYSIPMNPGAPQIADINNDSIPDVFVAFPGAGKLFIFLGKGDGTFDKKVRPVLKHILDPIPDDINRDGKVDMIIASSGSEDEDYPSILRVLLGNGKGKFTPSWSFQRFYMPMIRIPLLMDINGDEFKDIILSSFYNVYIFLGDGEGKFKEIGEYKVGNMAHTPARCDVDLDGYPDLIVSNEGSNDITLLLNGIPDVEINIDKIYCIIHPKGNVRADIRVINRTDVDLPIEGLLRVRDSNGEWLPIAAPIECILKGGFEKVISVKGKIPDYVPGDTYLFQASVGKPGDPFFYSSDASELEDCMLINASKRKNICLECH
ncbi:MAG: FG-GAP repeat domain-containing protein [Candidatus Glassbacteria bacterium]